MIAEGELDRLGLAKVADRGRGAVGVDVVDLLGLIFAWRMALFMQRAAPSPSGRGWVM